MIRCAHKWEMTCSRQTKRLELRRVNWAEIPCDLRRRSKEGSKRVMTTPSLALWPEQRKQPKAEEMSRMDKRMDKRT